MSNTPTNMEQEHLWAERMLPWQVNGTLSQADSERLQSHLRVCASCRRDLELESELASRVAVSPVVDYAPQASLARLMKRIDAEAQKKPVASDPPGLKRRTQRRASFSMTAALAVQAAALAVIAVTVLWVATRPAPVAEYRTLSAAPATLDARLQVVFTDTSTAEQIRSTLSSIGGHIVDGPSRAGVFLIEIESAGTPPEAAEQALQNAEKQLAGNPLVRYVAQVPGGPAQ
tara:strand:+ start:7546 stop:8238 length:693 start_codon:yes stop_codon:yes gene_type:complete